MATDLAILSKLTGITSDNAAGVYKQFAATGGATSQSALDMANTLAYTSQLMGVPMDVMFADVAESGEFIAQYMGQTTSEISKAAIQARLLGLTMKDVESITSSIMDFEGSIEKELMASILVGKQLNFNRARYLAMQGDISGATKEVMRQVGSLEEFNALNPIAAKALADAAGLTVEKLRDSLYTQKLIKSAGGDYAKELQRAQDIIDGTTKMSETERMAQDRANLSNRGAMKEMGDAWGQIGASLTKVVLPAIQGIAWALKGIADFILGIFRGMDASSGGADTFGAKLKKILVTIGAILVGIIAVKYVIAGMSGLMSKLPGLGGAGGGAGGAGGGGGFLGKIFGGLSPVKMLSGAAAILIISGALWVFAKALQELQKNDRLWETLGAAVIGLVALAAVAAALGGASPAILLGSLAIAVLAGALWILGKAVNEFVPYMKVLLDGITGFAEVVGKTIVNIINAVADSITKIGNIDALNLMGVAAGIGAVGLSLAAFGGGSIVAGIGSLIGNFLGGDPVEKFIALAKASAGLFIAASALQMMQSVLTKGLDFSNVDFDSIGTFTDKLQNMRGLSVSPIDVSVDKLNTPNLSSLDNTPSSISLPIETTTTLSDTIKVGDNLIIEKLNQLIETVNKQDIYLDNRKVNTNLGRNINTSKLN